MDATWSFETIVSGLRYSIEGKPEAKNSRSIHIDLTLEIRHRIFRASRPYHVRKSSIIIAAPSVGTLLGREFGFTNLEIFAENNWYDVASFRVRGLSNVYPCRWDQAPFLIFFTVTCPSILRHIRGCSLAKR
jgi:hypothetical protein